MFSSGIVRNGSDRRGQSEVIGVVLLLSVTMIGITAVAASGAMVLGDAQTDSRVAQMENSMAQMSSKASLVALGESEGHSFDLGNLGDGTVDVREETGNVTVTHVDSNGTEEDLYEGYYGAVVATVGKTEIAYQGGGVWKKQGDRSMMVSPPEYHYQQRTLTFPIIRVVGDDHVSGPVRGQLINPEPQNTTSIYPNGTLERSNPLEDGEIVVEIESEYHEAWYDFFSSRSEGEVAHFPNEQIVRVNLVVPSDVSFENPVTVTESGGIDINGKGDPPSEWRDGINHYPSVTETIENRIEACTESTFDSENLTGGKTYCANDDVTLENSIEFDTTDGDINVVIDGQLNVGNNDITITGDNNVTIYLRDGFDLGGDAQVNQYENPEAEQFLIYVSSDAGKINAGSGSPALTGAIYAPNTDVDLSGNADFEGAIVSKLLTVNGNPSFENFSYDEELADIELDVTDSPDMVRYLHVTENRVKYNYSDESGK